MNSLAKLSCKPDILGGFQHRFFSMTFQKLKVVIPALRHQDRSMQLDGLLKHVDTEVFIEYCFYYFETNFSVFLLFDHRVVLI